MKTGTPFAVHAQDQEWGPRGNGERPASGSGFNQGFMQNDGRGTEARAERVGSLDFIQQVSVLSGRAGIPTGCNGRRQNHTTKEECFPLSPKPNGQELTGPDCSGELGADGRCSPVVKGRGRT
ncbi:hypothetical protein SKAU_G00364190 [Synaphobranchus kaupii]|uniref:Uncharacterized protein n=1 Tax=Synaphobranchus kaupii TaxID=118154 RepID=A0A9Q1ID67_SYNKA|nr:hypothetical protein SKAU_G00364190 [Synaphobranchus kaupii]